MKKLFGGISIYLIGLVLITIGYSLIINATLGNDTVSILSQGLAIFFGISIGQGSQLLNVTFLVIVLIFNRKLVGVGTFLTAILLGLGLDMLLSILPVVDILWLNMLALILGITIGGSGITFTIISKVGASPVDCMMLLISEKFNIKISRARIGMDLTMTGLGYILGGSLGIGTLVSSILIGPVIEQTRGRFSRLR